MSEIDWKSACKMLFAENRRLRKRLSQAEHKLEAQRYVLRHANWQGQKSNTKIATFGGQRKHLTKRIHLLEKSNHKLLRENNQLAEKLKAIQRRTTSQ